jgi:hypothetical protein
MVSMKNSIRKSCLVLVCTALMAFAKPDLSTTFNEHLERVDEALQTNPSLVLRQSLESCLQQRNADAKMVALIQQYDDRQMTAVFDYSSRLLPAAELRAPADWKNPGFN